MGGQTDLMISVRHIREFLLPGMKRMIDLAHQAGAYAFHHNDGSCWRIIPDMIELGIDLLNPLQWRCPGHGAGAAQDATSAAGSSSTAAWTTSTPCRSGRSTRSGARSRTISASSARAAATSWRPATTSRRSTPVENVLAMYEAGLRARPDSKSVEQPSRPVPRTPGPGVSRAR